MRRRSPQEKKRLSYLKDRRNVYGENQKSSRKNIPRARRARHHALRRGEQLALERLRAFGGALDDSQVRFGRRGTGQWRKSADRPLGEVVTHRLERRTGPGDEAPPRVQEQVRRVRRRRG
ncbi:hypothetical protein OH807_02065 [Kitasatospora sp. NBC_01560]|uniref:hypothetical protein n=1 Tax=Kitasatospora sp. NBC_01560 TaxID=2975965 RepID=UPI0038690CB8